MSPFLDKTRQLEYVRKWHAQRRADWFAANGPCCKCGSADRLELDHIDPASKVHHNIWSWSEVRRAAELAKCQVLCHACHMAKTRVDIASKAPCGTRARYKCGCKCEPCRAANAKYARDRKMRAVADSRPEPGIVAPSLVLAPYAAGVGR